MNDHYDIGVLFLFCYRVVCLNLIALQQCFRSIDEYKIRMNLSTVDFSPFILVLVFFLSFIWTMDQPSVNEMNTCTNEMRTACFTQYHHQHPYIRVHMTLSLIQTFNAVMFFIMYTYLMRYLLSIGVEKWCRGSRFRFI